MDGGLKPVLTWDLVITEYWLCPDAILVDSVSPFV
jgi:hypothetical protein